METVGFSTSQAMGFEPGGSDGSADRSADPKQFFRGVPWGYPKLAGWFFDGKSPAEMDDLGVPPWIGNLHISYHNYLGVSWYRWYIK